MAEPNWDLISTASAPQAPPSMGASWDAISAPAASKSTDMGGYSPSQVPQTLPGKEPFTLADTWPARLLKTVASAVTLPGDVYAGRVDPMSEEAIGRSADLASIATPMSVASRSAVPVAAAAARRVAPTIDELKSAAT